MRSDPPTGDELTRLLVSMKQNVLEQVANEPAPASAKRMPRADRIIGLTLGVLLLLGVGTGAAFALGVVPFGGEPGAAPVASPTSSEAVKPSPTPTPTPTPTPSEYVVEPGQPASRFGLDCETLIDGSLVTSLFSVDVTLVDPIVSAAGIGIAIPSRTSVLAVGGNLCEWSNSAPRNDQYGQNPEYTGVVVSVVPRPVAGWSERAVQYGMPSEWNRCDDGYCSASTAVGDAWVAVELVTDPALINGDAWLPFVDAVIAAVSAAGTAAPPGFAEQASIPSVDECSAIVPLEVVRSITSTPDAVANRDGGGGWSAWGEAMQAAGNFGCAWSPADTDGFVGGVHWIRDGAWAFQRMLQAGTSSPVELLGLSGDDAAVLRCDPAFGTSCAVDLRVGVDWLSVSASDQATAIALAEAVLAQRG